MKIFLISIFMIIGSCSSKKIARQLDNLYCNEDFFEFNRMLNNEKHKLSRQNQLYYFSLSMNLLNRPGESNQLIRQLIIKYSNKIPDSILARIYQTRASNYLRLYEYQQAYETLNHILAGYSPYFSESQIRDIRNDSSLYHILSRYQKQIINIPHDTYIPLSTDKAGLINVPVSGKDTSQYPFIFDTGANLSAISESMANKFNLNVFEGHIRGYAIGGEDEPGVGICPLIRIGDITVENVVFLILPDSSMYFKELDYRVNGIIGFPVMNAMKQFTITENDLFINDHVSSLKIQNFLLYDLQPVIEIEYNQIKIPCYFDSGAKRTSMFMAFYNRFKDDPSLCFSDTIANIGGGAGFHRFRVKRLDTINLNTAGKLFRLKKINIHTSDSILHGSARSYGNIGQDFIKNYKSMTINFEKMYIDFY